MRTRRTVPVWTSGFAVIVAAAGWPSPAQAQETDGGAVGIPMGPISADSYLWLQLYGIRAGIAAQAAGLPTATAASPSSGTGQVPSAPDYFTQGAEATAVPTAGPEAAYFTNGAEVFAAPTSVIPFPGPTDLSVSNSAGPIGEGGAAPNLASAAPASAGSSAPSGTRSVAEVAAPPSGNPLGLALGSTLRQASAATGVAGGAAATQASGDGVGAAPASASDSIDLRPSPGAQSEAQTGVGQFAPPRTESIPPMKPMGAPLALTTPNDVASSAERASGSTLPWLLGAVVAGVASAALARGWITRRRA